ncbi:uncharacterized protein YdeI (YjbR/CyaY-like superfamily) [Pedobacter cryoconitis]|uniref:Uncharacterized protein YdeI (YjbR/CyaY-like superfamily) n=1 Tax=Pedobacter cryoconitis TaxID=188932 RepID=A0A7W8ZSC2_9SPHI|nr:DUF1801 domain-containing protein [Pedobacter cryoconitis]MBB5639297.1 uncharacterized protein YdeI (YjbR/CyaY-like superfamily) [Pedobacter cryoconitis]
MGKLDNRIDLYIDNAAVYAQPILNHLRMLVHEACPEIIEKIKWGCPHFDYKGPVCHMAAFKNHCAFGFWKGALLPDLHHLVGEDKQHAMGHLGKLESVEDLPGDDVLITYIQNAVILNKEGVKLPKKTTAPRTDLQVPDDFVERLVTVPAAGINFEKFSYAKKKDYLEWFKDAKTEATRNKRMDTAIEWIIEGKSRNWKYEK